MNEYKRCAGFKKKGNFISPCKSKIKQTETYCYNHSLNTCKFINEINKYCNKRVERLFNNQKYCLKHEELIELNEEDKKEGPIITQFIND